MKRPLTSRSVCNGDVTGFACFRRIDDAAVEDVKVNADDVKSSCIAKLDSAAHGEAALRRQRRGINTDNCIAR